jgi:hypothetical protein
VVGTEGAGLVGAEHGGAFPVDVRSASTGPVIVRSGPVAAPSRCC